MELPAVFDDPVLLAVLVLAIFAVLQYQRTLSWAEYRHIHALKVRLAPVVDRYTNLFVLSRKRWRNDEEYLATVNGPVGKVFKALVRAGGSPHLVNSVKIRRLPDGTDQLSAAHVVWRHDDGTQTEVYLFPAPDDGVDVYAHHEVGVLDPEGHLSEPQTDGDPKGVVATALANSTLTLQFEDD